MTLIDLDSVLATYKLSSSRSENPHTSKDVRKRAEAALKRAEATIESSRKIKERSPVSTSAEDDLVSDKGVDYTRLRDFLKAGRWREADHETQQRMFEAVNRQEGFFTKEELLNFPDSDLKTIDSLWMKYSNGHFGFKVQKEIYVQCGAKLDGTYPTEAVWNEFCDLIGWSMNGWYIYYSDVKFDTLAPRGHLPALPLFSQAVKRALKERAVLLSHSTL